MMSNTDTDLDTVHDEKFVGIMKEIFEKSIAASFQYFTDTKQSIRHDIVVFDFLGFARFVSNGKWE